MNIFIQIAAGVILTYIIYLVVLVVLNLNKLVQPINRTVSQKDKTSIIDGYANAGALSSRSYNTTNFLMDDYRKLGRSINENGASFTYQFWGKFEDLDSQYFTDRIILLKGDKRKFKVGLYNRDTGALEDTKKPDHTIACPLIKFVDSYKHLKVTFNTNNDPYTSVSIKMNEEGGMIGRRNLLSLFGMDKWFLLTFVFEDNISTISGKPNGINFRFWVNDILYNEQLASTNPHLKNNTLKQNDGKLHLFPQGRMENGKFMILGNVKYFNYALDREEIQKIFNAGNPTKPAVLDDFGLAKPAFLSSYNKIDIYNY